MKMLFAQLGAALVVLVHAPCGALAQGILTPPGAPAPTMKTLSQIEPRTDLSTLAGDASAVHVIKGIGCYYLSRDIAGAGGKSTISVATAGRVTIDLNGFSLISTGTDQNAINLPAANDAVIIHNGIILAAAGAGKAVGGLAANVVCQNLSMVGSLDLGSDSVISQCQISRGGIQMGDRSSLHDSRISNPTNLNFSIQLGDDSQVSGVIFTTGRGELSVGSRALVADSHVNALGPSLLFSGAAAVLTASSSSVIRNCTVISATNTAGFGITIGEGSLVTGCRVFSAFREGISGNGPNVTVENCSVQNNGRVGISVLANGVVRDCTVQGSGTVGIAVGENSSVSDCNVHSCRGGGIRSTSENVLVSRCVLRGNSGAPGISLLSGTVSDYTVSANTGGAGIQVTQRSVVTGNRSENNGTVSPADPQAGLRIIGANNRLEANHLINNSGFGLEITAVAGTNTNIGNLVIRNHARSNSAGQYSISSSNAVGPIITTAGTATNLNPSANFGP